MIDIKSLADQIAYGKVTVEEAKQQHGLDESGWYRTANKIYQYALKQVPRHPDGDHDLMQTVSDKLARHAFCCPPYLTVAEAKRAVNLLSEPSPNAAGCIDELGLIVMRPARRALESVGRFAKIPLFAEFQYLVDASAKSYFSGNLPSAIITAIPVVEGMLLRWQGFPKSGKHLPDFEATKKFIGLSLTRNPTPARIHNHQIYCRTVDAILKDHFYLPSTSGKTPAEAFNRHWALHLMKKGAQFATRRNVYRAFLLLDLLTEIYVLETRMNDPRWQTKGNETASLFSEFERYLLTGILVQNISATPTG